jgi:hypothetical protein
MRFRKFSHETENGPTGVAISIPFSPFRTCRPNCFQALYEAHKEASGNWKLIRIRLLKLYR